LRCGGRIVILRAMGMLANEIFDHYLTSLLETPSVWLQYTDAALWTKEATRSLVHAGLQAFPNGQGVAKGYKDSFQRSEYLTLDVCIDDLETWGPPLFIAEHENAPRRAKIQYCAWKLLATVSQRRVLVAYYDSKSDVRDLPALEEAVREVCRDNPGREVPKDLLLFAADYNARPSSARGLRDAHTLSIIGVKA
jgi:hypothetical protein